MASRARAARPVALSPAESPAPSRSPGGGPEGHALSLDRLVHEKLRLGILSALAGQSPLSFGELKRLLDTTDGNLSVHARKLEDADYVACEKGFEGRVPRTLYRITPAGRRALDRYLAHMEALIASMRRVS